MMTTDPIVTAAQQSAQACVDMLRGIQVIVSQNKQGIAEVLGQASQGDTFDSLRVLAKDMADIIRQAPRPDEVRGCSSVEPSTSSSEALDDRGSKRARDQGLGAGHDVKLSSSGMSPHTMPQHPHTGQSAQKAVLTSAELLGHIFGMLLTGLKPREAVVAMGRVSLVGRRWAEAAMKQGLWGRVAKDVFPSIDGRATQAKLAQADGDHRRLLVRYGQMLSRRRRVIDTTLQSWTHAMYIMFDAYLRNDVNIMSGEFEFEIDVEDGWNTEVRPWRAVTNGESVMVDMSPVVGGADMSSFKLYLVNKNGEDVSVPEAQVALLFYAALGI